MFYNIIISIYTCIYNLQMYIVPNTKVIPTNSFFPKVILTHTKHKTHYTFILMHTHLKHN